MVITNNKYAEQCKLQCSGDYKQTPGPVALSLQYSELTCNFLIIGMMVRFDLEFDRFHFDGTTQSDKCQHFRHFPQLKKGKIYKFPVKTYPEEKKSGLAVEAF